MGWCKSCDSAKLPTVTNGAAYASLQGCSWVTGGLCYCNLGSPWHAAH